MAFCACPVVIDAMVSPSVPAFYVCCVLVVAVVAGAVPTHTGESALPSRTFQRAPAKEPAPKRSADDLPREHEHVRLADLNDEWYRRVFHTDPTGLTLQEIEDMTDDERIDYVHHHIKHWHAFTEHTMPNKMRRLRRMAQLARMRDRRRPGDGLGPLHDDPDVDLKHVGLSQSGSDDKSIVDERVSAPRWHHDDEVDRIKADPVWIRKTKPGRPNYESVAHASSCAANKVTAEDFERAAKAPEYDHSDVDLTPPDRSDVRAKRDKLAEMSAAEYREQLDADTAGYQCFAAASEFCVGHFYDFAAYLNCAFENRTKFKPEHKHCLRDLVAFYGPCIPDMMGHCKRMKSKETTDCLVKLVHRDMETLEREEKEQPETPGHLYLSSPCIHSDFIEAAVWSHKRPQALGVGDDAMHVQEPEEDL